MSDSQNFGFAKLVPGFDFLQNLTQGAAGGVPQMPQMAQLSSWIAPTLNVEDLDKRIQDLKAVHFWLEQNGKVLAATIQALEVQKMTLSTLQGMNLSMNELADSLKVKPPASPSADAGPSAKATPAAGAIDPMQWWGSLSQQFQQIAASALKEMPAVSPGAAKPAKAGAKAGARAPRKPAATRRAAPAPSSRGRSAR